MFLHPLILTITWGDIFFYVLSSIVFIPQKTGVVYLFEIRICFDKNLALTDCDGIKSVGADGSSMVITNCPTNKSIMYPVTAPQEISLSFPTGNFPQKPHLPWLLEFLNGIQWLQWFTMWFKDYSSITISCMNTNILFFGFFIAAMNYKFTTHLVNILFCN